jgi:hypothetical protein
MSRLPPKKPPRRRRRTMRPVGRMCVLFDKSAPHGLVRHLEGHAVSTAEECGWDRLANGPLNS